MESIEEVKEQRKIGCLKWTCGGCVCIVLLLVVAGVFVWVTFAKWNRGESPWEHMPPSTRCAVEAHDLQALISRGLNDPGVQALMRVGSKQLQEFVTEVSGEQGGNIDNAVGDFVEMYNSLGFLHIVVLPNSFLFGVSSFSEEEEEVEIFVIFRPPTWARWALDIPEEGAPIIVHREGNSTPMHIFSRDGWLVVASAQELAEEIRDNWNTKSLPLGPSPAASEPYFAMALYLTPEDFGSDADTDAAAPAEPPMTFNTPFAFQNNDVPSGPPVAENTGGENIEKIRHSYRMIVKPATDGWMIEGEYAGTEQTFAKTLSVALGEAIPVDATMELPAGADFELVAAFPPSFKKMAIDYLDEHVDTPSPRTDPTWLALPWMWLHDSWLTTMGDSLAVYARAPVAETADGVPPSPVFSMGWTISPDIAPDKAAEDFTASFATTLDAITGGGATPAEQALLDNLTYQLRRDETGVGGVVDIPPVALNSARPAWFFPASAQPAQGWLATDPAGLPSGDGRPQPQWNILGKPVDNQVHAALSWNLSWEFRQGFEDWILDRWENLADPEEGRDEGEKAVLQIARLVKHTLAAFPKGGATVRVDAASGHVFVKSFIPKGVDAE